MLYHLFYPLRHQFIGFNLLTYITFRSAAAAVSALILTFIFAPSVIRWLRRKELGEEIRDDGPKTHLNKAGTPTMGGIIVIPAVVIPVLLFASIAQSIPLTTPSSPIACTINPSRPASLII